MRRKEIILAYLNKAYSEAKEANDVTMMIRLTRAMIAFNCDKFDEVPNWEEMMEEYMLEGRK